MKVSDIIKEVRWRIDEESNNTSNITDEKDDSYMDNVIEANIPDALHWIAITATSSSALSGSTTASKKEETPSNPTASTTTTMQVETFEDSNDIGVITMQETVSVFNINRVRAKGWHKAVVPVEDTDDEALMMFDDTAKGTFDRPLAAIMRVSPLKVLVQPKPTDGSVIISYVGVPTNITTSEDGEKTVEISETFKDAFIHYLAFLLLSAYNDTKANQMYTIALQQLGVSQTSKQ